MRYVKIQTPEGARWGVLKGETILTLTKPPFQGIHYDGNQVLYRDAVLLPPCEATKIVCVGKNYYDHAVEMKEGVPEHPILFLKGPNCLNRHEGEIEAPPFVKRLDYEGELAFVVGKRAKRVLPEHAMEYILGYTCLNDVTARDIQKGDGQWTRGKSMDGFAPIGPVLTDEVSPDALHIETRLNGNVVQTGNTNLFMTKLPEMIAFITASMTLEPGDVVATGTPAGIGPMKPGDVVEVEIEGIGTLRNYVKAPSE